MKKALGIVAVVLGMSAGALLADVVHLKGGKRVEGTFLGGDTRQVRLLASDGTTQTFDIGDIDSIRFSSTSTSSAAPAPAAAESRPRLTRAEAAPAAAPAARELVPAGTVITVRMIDSVDSDVTHAGERFRASLDDPLQVGERTIAPRGSDVTVQVVRVQQSGKLTGRDEVSLDLFDITVNGKRYAVASSYAEVASASRGARTAKVVGGTAALGAIIGAIAGGGKGAAIGAGAGAATGVGIESVTHGQRVKIPAETRLDFTLKQPLAVD